MKQLGKKLLSASLLLVILTTCIPVVHAETAVYPGDIRWDFTNGAEGFLPKDEKTTIEETNDGTIVVTTNGDKDPNIYIEGLKIDPNIHKFLRFRMKNNSKSWLGEGYIYTNNLANRIKITGYNIDNQSTNWKEYVVPIDYSVMDKGNPQEYYTGFRLDYINAYDSGSVEIDYIILSNNDNAVNDSVIEGVSIRGNKIDEFDSEKDYCETDIYEDIYKELSEEDIEIQVKDEYKDAEIYVLINTVADRKFIDIAAVCGEQIRSYRIVCKDIQRPAFLTVDSCTINGKFISISGFVVDEEGKALERPITVIAHKKGEEITANTVKYLRVLMPDSDGKFNRIIKINDSETTAEYYTMEVLVDVKGATAPVVNDVLYINNTKREESIEEMKTSPLAVYEFMSEEENEDIYIGMGVWVDLYNNSMTDVKAKMNKAISDYKEELTVDNTSEITNGTILAVLTETGNMLDIITKYDEKVKSIKIVDAEFKDLDENSRQWIADNVSENKPFETYEEFYASIREGMLLEKINNTTYMELCDILLNNTEILDNNMTKLKNETDEDIRDEAMRIVVSKAKKDEFRAVEDVIESVNKALDTASGSETKKPSSQGGSSSGKGSGGGGSQYVASGEVKKEDDENNVTDTESIFNDLDGYEWAEPAILKLNSLGVVSGTGNGVFEPGRFVTREEFVKLMCKAFDLDIRNDAVSPFTDVKSNDWFFDYIMGAYEAEIVTGVSENRFGTGEKISREDMTVMMYRALENEGYNMDGFRNEFDDKNEISEYAEEAVGAMAAQGIINGIGNNMFAPKETATRAEAAVIILRCMEKFSL